MYGKTVSNQAALRSNLARKQIMFHPTTEDIATGIVHAAYRVHRTLGPGLLERIYESCLAYELRKAGYRVERQIPLPIVYDGLVFEEGLRLDLLVENRIIIEIKAADHPHPIWTAQLLSHLKLTDKKLGFLINFNVPLLRDGIKRYIHTKT